MPKSDANERLALAYQQFWLANLKIRLLGLITGLGEG